MVLLAIAVALQAAEPESPVSVARVRARLAQPASLQITLPELPLPTFRLEVRAHRYWTDEPLTWNFKTPPMSPLSPPQRVGEPEIGATGGSGGGVDLLSAIAAARHSVQERAAQKEVQKALAEYCAIHGCSQW